MAAITPGENLNQRCSGLCTQGGWPFAAAVRKSSAASKSVEESFDIWAEFDIPAQIPVRRRDVTIYGQSFNRLQINKLKIPLTRHT